MRNELERRPLLLGFLALLLGLSIPAHPLNAFLAAAFVWPCGKSLRNWSFAAVFLSLGLVLSPPSPALILDKSAFRGEATIVDVPTQRPDSVTSLVEVDGVALKLDVRGAANLSYRDRISVSGEIRPLKESEAMYWLPQGATGVLRVDAAQVQIMEAGPAFYRWGNQFRERFLAFCQRTMSPGVWGFVAALTFNADWTLDPSTKDHLRRSGTMHIISASGLHVSIFAWVVAGLLTVLPVPRVIQLLILASVLILYASAAGLHAAVLRAVLMCLVMAVAYLFRRSPDGISALALSGILYALWQPRAIYDIGFQLSYVTVFVLFALGGFSEIDDQPLFTTVKKRVVEAARSSLIATAGSAPLVGYFFGYVSIISVFANLLIALPAAFIIVVPIACLPLDVLAPGVAKLVMGVTVEPLVWWTQGVIDLCGTPTWVALDMPDYSAYWIPATIFLLLYAFWRPVARPA